VQVDPIKPMSKAPGTKRLKLEFDELLSSFALKFSLRRYTLGSDAYGSMRALEELRLQEILGRAAQVDPIKPMLKPPGTKRLKLKCVILLSTSAFKFNLRRYN